MSEFSIALDGTISAGLGLPSGRIVVGAWEETFAIAPIPDHPRPELSFEDLWRAELGRLVDGAAAVALPVQAGRAWVLYREHEEVFVQDQLFIVPGLDGEAVLDAAVFAITPRETVSEDGCPISEWVTTIDAIRSFLEDTRRQLRRPKGGGGIGRRPRSANT